MSSDSSAISNSLMNIQDEITDFASVDHLGSVWLNGMEMLMELTNKGASSVDFKKAVKSFAKSVRQNKAREDSNPLKDAGYAFCEALSMVFTDLSKKAKSKDEKESCRSVPHSLPSTSTHETRSSKKKQVILQRTTTENEARPVQPLKLLRCGDCPDIFRQRADLLQHRKMHSIEGPSVVDAVKTRNDRKRKQIYCPDEETVAHPIKTARLAIAAPPPKDEMQCQFCEKKYKTTRWLNKHLEEKHDLVTIE